MATEDWIQESLARLESLEEERNKHEAALETADDASTLRMHTQAIERLDAKIRALYAELEAVADQGGGGGDGDGDGDDEDDDDDAADTADHAGSSHSDNDSPEVATRLFRREDVAAQAAAAGAASPFTSPAQAAPAPASPFGGAAQPAPASPFGGAAQPAPFASPEPAHAAPFGGSTPAAAPFGGSAPAAAPFGGSAPAAAPFGGSSGSYDDGESHGFSAPSSFGGSAGGNLDDDSGSGGGAKLGIIIAVVLVVGGLGAYFAFGGKKEAPPPAEPTGPAQVIRAGEVPPDTQGPKSIKGGNADGTKGSLIKEGRPNVGGSGGSGNSGSSSTPEKAKKKDPRTNIHQTDDPLAGIDK